MFDGRQRLVLWTGLFLLLSPCLDTEGAAPAVGAPAPPLGLKQILQAPPGTDATWSALAGKVVVLEFWATSCGPCVRAIPFLNGLQESYRDKPVQFIAITDETESVVARFLEKRPLTCWIGLDTSKSVFERYGVHALPTTIIVDQQGRLAGWTSIMELVNKPEILDDLLAGRIPKLADAPPRTAPTLDSRLFAVDGSDAALCRVMITPASGTRQPLHSAGPGQVARFGVTLRAAIAWAFDFPYSRIVSSTPLPEGDKFDIVASLPQRSKATAKTLVGQALAAAFGLDFRREHRQMEVYVLAPVPGKSTTLEPTIGGVFFDPDTGHSAPTQEALDRMNAGETYFFAMGTMEILTDHLGYYLDRPVIDESGDSECCYLFFFPYDTARPDPDDLIKIMEEKYVLTLQRAMRGIDVLAVGPSTPQ